MHRPAFVAAWLIGLSLNPTWVLAGTIDVPADYALIQEAIEAAQDGDTVRVAPGTYLERIDYLGKAIEVVSTDGYASTVIDGQQGGAVVVFNSNETNASVLRGFTITNGTGFGNVGGGIYAGAGAPTVIDCFITQNAVHDSEPIITHGGGGFYSQAGFRPRLIGCTFTDNQATDDYTFHTAVGGAIFASDIEIRDCHIRDNLANGNGGGCWLYGGAIDIVDTVFENNRVASSNGGTGFTGGALGVVASEGRVRLERCWIEGNASPSDTVYTLNFPGGETVIRNCLVVGNTGHGVSTNGGVRLDHVTVVDNEGDGLWGLFNVVNSIVRGNTGIQVGHSSNVTFSNIEGGYPGNGNIDIDPRFVDAQLGDFRLDRGSPCIDVGDPSYVSENGSTRDLAQNSRILDGDLMAGMRSDMGAYEFTNLRMAITGQPTPGGQITVELSGEPTFSVVLMVGFEESELRLQPYGYLFPMGSTWFTIGWPSPPSTLTIPLGSNIPSPVSLILQPIGFQGPGLGNVGNPAFLSIE